MDNLKNKVAGIAVAVTLSVGGAVAIDQTQLAIPVECDMQAAKVESLDEKLRTYRIDEGFIQTREMTRKDRASIKGCEIAKIKSTTRERVQYSGADYQIEITDIQPIDGGVAVFAKAWTPEGKQLGFGIDGSVEIERFMIYNPPILVQDPTGQIISTSTNQTTGVIETRRLKEDPVLAMKQSIAHTISVKKEVFSDAKIIPGKVGNTTSTFYPDASVESTSVDGYHEQSDGVTCNDANWDVVHDAAASDTVNDNGTTMIINGGCPNAGRITIRRALTIFDTSALPDTDTVSSATVSLYGQALQITVSNNGGNFVAPVTATTTSDTVMQTADYDLMDSINNPVTIAPQILSGSLSASAYNNWTLFSTTTERVSKTAVTKIGWRIGWDIVDVRPNSTSVEQYLITYTADQTGTTNDPKLVVEHSAAAGGPTPGANDVIWFN